MKKKVLIPLLILGALIAFFSFRYTHAGVSSPDERRLLVLNSVMKTIEQGHFAPRPLDDSFSVIVYDDMLKTLDFDKRFFTQKDIAMLAPYRFKIDNQVKEGTFDFYDKLSEIYNKKIQVTEGFYKELLQKPFAFTGNDSIQLSGEEIKYAANDVELKARWQKFLKYRVLAKYVDLQKEQEKKKANKDSANVALKTNVQLEAEARQSILKNQDLIFKRLRKFSAQEQFNFYINALTAAQDPHTNYLAPKDKKRFDEGMSGSFVGIGAQLREEDGKIKVIAIIVGSPSWKQGELKAGDEIMKVAQGNGEPEDITGLEIDDVVSKIRGKKGTTVNLTVKRIDGAQKVIGIVRGEVSMEETFAKSAIIESPMGKIGYIVLPEFYVDFNNPAGRRSGTDVETEVRKLMEEKVSGIIIDLRNNGGGSLSDVVDIAGLFINDGPIVQVKSSGAGAVTLKDNSRGALFSGPLAIMVNQGSASASEILAAAMQDYGRAVIIGSPTFGKGTVQRVANLDEGLDPITRLALAQKANGMESLASLGALKITVQKFYRVNGGSTQLKGVTPDFILPDIYEQLDLGERKEQAALQWDEIKPANYQKVNSIGNLAALQAASNKRVSNNEIFKLIRQNAGKMKAMEKDNVYPLNEVAYRKKLDNNVRESEKMEELEKKGTPLAVANPKKDMVLINRDTSSVTKNADWLKQVKKDIYISEAVNILNDLAGQKTRVITTTEQLFDR